MNPVGNPSNQRWCVSTECARVQRRTRSEAEGMRFHMQRQMASESLNPGFIHDLSPALAISPQPSSCKQPCCSNASCS